MIKTREEKLININLSRADIKILIESLEQTSPRIKNKTISRDNYELLYYLRNRIWIGQHFLPILKGSTILT